MVLSASDGEVEVVLSTSGGEGDVVLLTIVSSLCGSVHPSLTIAAYFTGNLEIFIHPAPA